MQDEKIYVKLQENVINYKHGNTKLSEDIVKSFEKFLYKYQNFFFYNIFDIKDSSLRKFVSLYFPLKSTNFDIQYIHKPAYESFLKNSANKVRSYYRSIYDTEEDIFCELVRALLNMAKRYSDYEKPSFHTYVQRCFHYELFNEHRSLTNDALCSLRKVSVEGIEDNYSITTKECKKVFINKLSVNKEHIVVDELDKKIKLKNSNIPTIINDDFSVFDDSTLNLNWINGVTCNELFKTLSSFEREIVLEHSLNKKTDTEISKKYGLCRSTINRKRLIAVQKIKKYLEEKGLNIDDL